MSMTIFACAAISGSLMSWPRIYVAHFKWMAQASG